MKYLLNRNLFFFSGLITILLNSFTVSAQSQLSKEETQGLLKKIDESLGNIKTVVYKIEYKKKFLSLKDTINTTAVCSLYIAPKDRMKAYNIVDMKERGVYVHRRYDGKRTFCAGYPINALDVYIEPYIDKNKKMMESVIAEYERLLLSEYLLEENPFRKYELGIQAIMVKEEMYNNTPVYVLFWEVEEPDEVCGIITGFTKHIIRKSDYLPIAFTRVQKCEIMIQYDSAEVEYLAINPDIPLESFRVDKNEAINPAERYKLLKEKANIED